jgi:hypothetical protein
MSAPQESMAKRRFRWVMMNTLLVAFAILALGYQQRWADNVFSFVTAVLTILSLMVYDSGVREDARKRGRSMPAWLGFSIDVGIMLGCAACGYFWLASAWMWQIIAEAALYAPATTKGDK